MCNLLRRLTAFLAAASASWSVAVAVTTNWNTSSSGSFNVAANWDNGVPGANDTAVFRRGPGATYTVTFPGNNPIFLPPLERINDRLIVGYNDVTFANAPGRAAIYTLDNPDTTEAGRAVIIGQLGGGETAALISSIPISTAAATLGDQQLAVGQLNMTAGTFTVTGSSASDKELIIGNRGVAAMHVTGGADVTLTGVDAESDIGKVAGSTGTAEITGAGSTWTTPRLIVGDSGTGHVMILNGGNVSISAETILGRSTGSHGDVTVMGAGSMLHTGAFDIGAEGEGELMIRDGAAVVSSGRADISFTGSAMAVVDGVGSTWTVNDQLDASSGSTPNDHAILRISSGGSVSSTEGSVESFGDSTVDVLVTGAGSTWSMTGGFGMFGATVRVEAGGHVTSRSGRVFGGRFEVAGVGSIWTVGEHIDIGIVEGAFVMEDGGTSTCASANIGVSIDAVGEVTVTGAGSSWSVSQLLTIAQHNTGSMLVEAGGHVTCGSASLGALSSGVASVTVSGAGSQWTVAQSVDVGGAGTGLVDIKTGGKASVAHDINLATNSTLKLEGGELSADAINFSGGQFQWTGGTLHVGTHHASLTNPGGGVLAPGNSAGSTLILGDYTELSGAAMEFEIGGVGQGTQYDFVNVTGTALLDGELRLKLIGGFAPTGAQTFALLTSTNLLGVLDNAGNGQRIVTIDHGGSFVVHYGPSSTFNPDFLVLSNFRRIDAADFDEDGDVDGADLIKWKTGFGTQTAATHMQGDANADGRVDGADFLIWQRQFGSPDGLAAAIGASVPEPATPALMALAIVAVEEELRSKLRRFRNGRRSATSSPTTFTVLVVLVG